MDIEYESSIFEQLLRTAEINIQIQCYLGNSYFCGPTFSLNSDISKYLLLLLLIRVSYCSQNSMVQG